VAGIVELDALTITLLSLPVVVLVNRLMGARISSRLLVFLLIMCSQLLLFLMRPSGLLVLYPWEYLFLYTPAYWVAYSLVKALVTGLIAARHRVVGLWLLAIALLQPIATAANMAVIGPPRRITLILGNESLEALVADTRLRASCGYYCWPKADAIVFTRHPVGRAEVTMLGISTHLLLILARNGTITKVLHMKPWRVYEITIPPDTTVIETRLPVHIAPGLPARLEPLPTRD